MHRLINQVNRLNINIEIERNPSQSYQLLTFRTLGVDLN